MRVPSQDGQLPAEAPAFPSPNPNLKRRRFLLALGAGSAATAAATSQSIAAPVAESTASAPEQSSGYHETQHIRDYYASTRL